LSVHRHGLALAGTIALLACVSGVQASVTSPEPMLDIDVQAGLPLGTVGDEGEGTALALQTLDASERDALTQSLSRVASEAALRNNPIVEDLEDHDERPNLALLGSGAQAAVEAAFALTRSRWVTADGQIAVRITRSCRPGHLCRPLAGARYSSEPAVRTAAFLAWAQTSSVRLSCGSSLEARRSARALRAHLTQSGNLALVVAHEDLARADSDESVGRLVTLIDQGAKQDEALRYLSRGLGAYARGEPARLPVELRPSELLLVPRFGAKHEDLSAEIRARVQNAASSCTIASELE
jgi:hypothetical protein